MRNRIPCSAEQLGQLAPDMLRSVVGGQVFKLGERYWTEHRVHRHESAPDHIVAEVKGSHGVYAQTIRLKGGTLSTKCTCPASEQPFCRHCVAVLLDFYHAQPSPAPVQTPDPAPATEASSPSASSSTNPPTMELQFLEVTLFIGWVRSMVEALKQEAPMPNLPDMGNGEAKQWAEALKELGTHHLNTKKAIENLENQLRENESQIASLTRSLEETGKEEKESKARCATLQHELTHCQDLLEQYADVAKERDRYVDQLTGMRGELLRKSADLETLAASIKQVSSALQAVTPTIR